MPQRAQVKLGFSFLVATTLFASAALAACGGGKPGAKSAKGGGAPMAIPGAPGPAEQLAKGGKSYADNCSTCHGDKGEGDAPSPAIIGNGALPEAPAKDAELRKSKFVTAQDVYDFTVKTMPKDGVGTVPGDEIWAITAWTLKQNGVEWGTDPLGPANASTVKLRK
jgi:cytochrome c